MQKLAVTSKIRQMDARTVLIPHFAEQFLKKFDSNEKKIHPLVYTKHIQYIKHKHIEKLTEQSPLYGVRHIFKSNPEWTTSQ